MADYYVVDREQLDADMTGVADHIRAKAEISTPLEWPDGYKAAVDAIPTGVELPELTNPGDASKLLAGYQLIDGNGAVVDGNIPTVDAATPGLAFQANGDVVAYVDQAAGYTTGGYKTYKQSQDVIPAQTITPGTEDQVIPAYHYLTGKQTIKGEPNLVPENIPEDVVLFGVQGERKMSVSTHAPEPESKDVDFYDYDGTRLYSYTLAEAQALTELPPLPSREGLICQGWNWTLSEIKDWGKIVDVGATYTTDDGATRIYISLSSLLNMPMTLHYSQTVDAGVTIDWGDGSPAETASGTGNVSLSHEYTEKGHYTISMKATSGTASFDNRKVFGESYANQNSIQRVEIGDSFTKIGKEALLYARGMKTISISNSVTAGMTDNLRYSGLQAVVFPRSMTSLSFSYNGLYGCGALRMVSAAPTAGGDSITNNSGVRECAVLRRVTSARVAAHMNNYEFNGCQALETISFNPGPSLTQIGTAVFSGCYSLREFEIPATITSIAAQAFYRCYSMQSLRFKPATPPTVANANAFTDIPTTCVVEVPAASLAAYQAATNYSGIAAQMVGV